MSRALLQQALDALENHAGNYKLTRKEGVVHNAAIVALRAAIAQPEPEPEPEPEPAKPLTEQKKRELAENYFAEDWLIEKAVNMLEDYEASPGIRPAPKVRRARPDDTEGGAI